MSETPDVGPPPDDAYAALAGNGEPYRTTLSAATPIGTLLRQAVALYRLNIAPILATTALLLVPLSLLKAGASALILAPTAAAEAAGAPAAIGGLLTVLLSFVAATVGIALVYGLAIPVATGALTLLVVDRAAGGNATPLEAYRLMQRRISALMSALIPAFILVLVGLFFLVIPGLLMGFLFSFVTPVVLLENLGGFSALKRSVDLVHANWLQVAVVALVFFGLRIGCSAVVGVLVPHTSFFAGSFVEDILLMLFLPIPILGTVLLYLDIRAQGATPLATGDPSGQTAKWNSGSARRVSQ